MLLGGIRYLLPVIEAAHKLGAYVITADYLPDNIAHKYSDEYVNVSIIDRDAVLNVAQEKQIDGILSFGVDPGVVTAAYVAEKMGLPSPPLASVEILQNKDKFRDFLAANGFNCPWHKGYRSKEEAMREWRSGGIESGGICGFPAIVKPVDSAGSKGCTRVDSFDELSVAIDGAIAESHSGRFIIEQFLEKVGASSDTDCFSIDNKLCFCSFNNQYFDAESPNPYVPAGFVWPSEMPVDVQGNLRDEIQRLIRLLNMGTSIYNVETRLATNGVPYIMEISPRGGGNRLAEMLRFASGQDLIENAVRMALGLTMLGMSSPNYVGYWAELILHSNKAGVFNGLEIDDTYKSNVLQKDVWIAPGDLVGESTGANQTIGTLVLRFNSYEEARVAITSSSKWVKVLLGK